MNIGKTGACSFMRVFKGYRGENRSILGEYRCIWEKTGVYSFMHDEYCWILVYNGVYTCILVKKRVFRDIALKTGVF